MACAPWLNDLSKDGVWLERQTDPVSRRNTPAATNRLAFAAIRCTSTSGKGESKNGLNVV
jgi:hypothetical protein